MSKKHQRSSRSSRTADTLYSQVRRQLAKGHVRQALKDARVLYRSDRSPEHRQLLAEACLARTDALLRIGLPSQARETLSELLELGPVTAEMEPEVVRLRVLLGMLDGPAPLLSDLASPLATQLADLAVMEPARVPAVYSDLLAQATQVRTSLQAIEQGNDHHALELLQGLGHKSPLADWKLFARGLSAHYAGDAVRRDSNWQRLDPQRAAHRIARVVQAYGGARNTAADQLDTARRLRRLERALGGMAALDALQEISAAFRAQRIPDALQLFRKFALFHAATCPAAVVGITDIFWKHLVETGNAVAFQALKGFAPPPALDPHWHRAEALLDEKRKTHVRNPVPAWERYRTDLAQLAALRDEERPLAQALVCLRMAANLEQELDNYKASLFFGADDSDYRPPPRLQREIVACYRAAIQHYPQLETAYSQLGELYRKWGQPDQAASTYQTMLKHFPSHTEAIKWLAAHFLDANLPLKAEPYVVEMQRLRPRDRDTQILLWNKHLIMARYAVRKRDFDLARRELDAARTEQHVPGTWVAAVRVAVELKAKNLQGAQQWIDRTLAQLDEPTAFWMILEANATRHGIDRAWKKEFASRFKTGLAGPPSTAVAGQMAAFLLTFRKCGEKYTGLATHLRALRAYLRRCERLAWQPDQLQAACQFIEADLDGGLHPTWLERFARLGRTQFPTNPHFHFYSAQAQGARGPFGCDIPQAIAHFERALQLNPHAASPLEPEQLNTAKRMLTVLREHAEQLAAPPFADMCPWDDPAEPSSESDDVDRTARSRRRGTRQPPFIDAMPPDIRAMFAQLMELMESVGDDGDGDDDDDEVPAGGGRRRGGRRGRRR